MKISLDISCDFVFPEVSIVLWPDKVSTSFMTVPETAVYKNNGFVFGKDYIWLSGKSTVIFSVTKAKGEQMLTDLLFRLGVLVTYLGHVITACLFVMNV